MSTCKECKFWGAPEPPPKRKRKWHMCAIVEENVSATCDCSYGNSEPEEFHTHEDFGCIHFEAKP